MGGLGPLLITLLSAVAPNGFVLLAALDTPEVRRELPVDAFLRLVPRVWVVPHASREPMMAFYAPAGEPEEGAGEPPLDPWLLAAGVRAERLLPGLRLPRIFLYAPYYTEGGEAGGRIKPARDMPIDVAQYFATALIEASLDLDPPPGLAAGASAYGPEIPAAERRDAYLWALAQFGSDAFSVAVEMRRSLARQRAAGKDPCAIVDHPATLFGLWERIFTTNEYRGLYRPAGGRPGQWALGPPLEKSDKKLLADRLFGGFWSGDVRRDFHLECP